MTQGKYKGRGWWGDSQGHSLAGKGVKIYAKKKNLIDPVFLARKQEQSVPFTHIMDMAQRKMYFSEMKSQYPHADSEDLRKRAIKAIEMREGNNTLSTLDGQGIDMTVKKAEMDPRFKQNALYALKDGHKSSFLPSEKVELLNRRLT